MTTNIGQEVRMTFTRRPTVVPPDIRPEWRLPLLLLMVAHCRANTASREQLHVLNSALLSDASRSALLAAMDGRLAPNAPVVQFEPALDRAIDQAVGLGLLQPNTQGRLALTDVGKSIVATLADEHQLFTEERALLAALPRSLSQTAIHKVLIARRHR